MARDYITLGSAPVDEPCAQVGSPNYHSAALAECGRYVELLLAKFGEPPSGAALVRRSFPHDFGAYYEVCVVYDTDEEEAYRYAIFLENNLPLTWSDTTPLLAGAAG